jgi:transaldolase
MNATTTLRAAGQRLWLDTISRQLLESGTLQHYIDEYGITGVTSNPTILSREIAGGDQYDNTLAAPPEPDVRDVEQLVYEWAMADAQRAADLLRPTWEATSGIDGWVSIEVPPTLAYQPGLTLDWARFLHAKTGRPNIFIKVPATAPGLAAIEDLTAAGVPINATLVFDARQHRAVEDSYLRGLERRRHAGLSLRVTSVTSVFVSRWDQATNPFLPPASRNRAGLAIAREIYADHYRTLAGPRWAQLAAAGADAQRLVWASTSAKDPALAPTYYVERLPRVGTINTMPETTLLALGRNELSDHTNPEPADAAEPLADAGIDQHELADSLLQQGIRAFAADWADLLDSVRARHASADTRAKAARSGRR